jgi:toxin ParE1/3/4
VTGRAAFTPRAINDVQAAFVWYESQRFRLGSKLLDEIDRALDTVSAMPQMGRIVHRGLRQVTLRRFPYVMYYREDAIGVEILAFLHSRRARDP